MSDSPSPPLLSLPLVLDGDAFSLELRLLPRQRIELVHIFRFPGNQNTTPVAENILHLSQSTRREIFACISRYYPGRTITVP